MLTRALLLGIASLLVCAAQNPYALNVKEQCIAVVPLQGKGTLADPIRPMFTPAKPPAKRDPKGIDGYTWRLTDDKKSALVIFTAGNRAAFNPILSDSRVKAYVKGKDRRDVVERGIQQHVEDFSFDDPHGLKKGQSK